MDYTIIDQEALENAIAKLNQTFKRLVEILGEWVEKVAEIVEELKESANKPKYKLIKSLVKPYKQPFIKIKYRARANL